MERIREREHSPLAERNAQKTDQPKETIDLIFYEGEYYVSLAEYTETRDLMYYSDYPSLKSSIRSVLNSTRYEGKYFSLVGKENIKPLIKQNQGNPMYSGRLDHVGIVALIHFSVIPDIEEKFPTRKRDKALFKKFMEEAQEYITDQTTTTDGSWDIVSTTRDQFLQVISDSIRKIDMEISKREREINEIKKRREDLENTLHTVEKLNVFSNSITQ